ncbi:MAG: NUDIX domain-containing protein [Lachnospirales bacterium]
MVEHKIVSSKEMYKGKIFTIKQDEITLPDGKIGKRDILIHSGAAAVLPVDENGNIILVRQYRHPIKETILELPAGKLEVGEDPMLCGKRELEEEIGYTSSDFTFMFKTAIAVGYSSEIIHIYLAKDLVKGVQNLDDGEFLDVETYTLDEVLKMIKNGEITDSKTIATVLYYKEFYC